LDKVQAEESIQVIRDIMERSARYTNFSGVSGIIAGCLALVGCGFTYWIAYNVHIYDQSKWSAVTWVSVLVAAVAQDFFLAQRKARRRGETMFTPATFQVVKAVLPGVLIAFVISRRALMLQDWDAIPATWALGYGAAACAAGMFSVKEVRVLGVAELVTGVVALFYFSTFDYSIYVLALAFGVYHILFGLCMSRKYGW
jgi:hypothetical protein